MKGVFLIMLLIIPFFIYSQDLIILRSGDKIECKITKVDSSTVYYDFLKGERKLSSYVAKSDIHSYKINSADSSQGKANDGSLFGENAVIIDTTKFIKEINKWINLATFSQRFGIHAKGWSVHYYGYNLKSTSRWSIPVLVGIEVFDIYMDYFSQFNYYSAEMNYFLAGISPFYRLNDNFFINTGINLIIGDEQLTDFYNYKSSHTFFGITPSQGIYFISGSKVGITLALGIYEKLLNSKVYKNDFGLKLEIGIKF